MNLKYLKLFEQYSDGKFSVDDIDIARKSNKGIRTSIVKDLPNHDPDDFLKIINIDIDKNEITVSIGTGIYYVDLKNIEEIEQ